MRRLEYFRSGLCLSLALVVGLTPKLTLAQSRTTGEERPFRLFASAEYGPIGKVETVGSLTINGHLASGSEEIWDNALILTPADGQALVSLYAVGRVWVAASTEVRLSTTVTTLIDGARGRVLIGSLASGAIGVKLGPAACAFVEASGCAYQAAAGADFRIDTRDASSIPSVRGAVEGGKNGQGQPQGMFKITFLDSNGRPTKQYKLRKGAKEEIAAQLKDAPIRPDKLELFAGVGFTPGGTQNAGPSAQGIEVRFKLFDAIASPEDFTTGTGPGQIARVTLTGTRKGSTTIRATAVKSNDYEEATLSVVSRIPFKKVAIAAGIAAVIIFCTQHCGPRKDPIKTLPPPRIP